MDISKETALVDAVLFLESEPVTIQNLQKITGLQKEIIELALENLKDNYGSSLKSGMELIEVNNGYQLVPKEELWDVLKERYGKKNENRLSRAALETLSIIAYSQPVTRGEVEGIRGVSADNMIRFLLGKNLIRELGKKDVPGKPVQYGTTEEFLKVFRLKSISELPKLDDVEQERFELNG
ncbi:MAG: SMC-Scp complex subunit ScpB [Spirochaetales bacterium]|nr:MAG: SMC-Scp complex subunit ScpB [Spirochaetales bacterium]